MQLDGGFLMAPETPVTRQRRAFLAAGLGAIAATIANALGRPSPAAAANAVLEVNNPVTGTTSFENNSTNATVFIGSSLTAGTGVHGYSTNGTGVRAQSESGYGVYATSSSYAAVGGLSTSGVGVTGDSDSQFGVSGHSLSNHGVRGSSQGKFGVIGVNGIGNSVGVVGASGHNDTPTDWWAATAVVGFTKNVANQRGVLGQTIDGTGVHGHVGDGVPAAPVQKAGVYGRCDLDAASYGVFGYSAAGTGSRGSTGSGTGVLGVATTAAGFGLRSIGRLSFQKASGVATIAAGTSSVTVTPGTDVVASTFVIVTPQGNPGGRQAWATTDATANTITIYVSSAVAANLKVAWLALG
jgi:hypothetical protein